MPSPQISRRSLLAAMAGVPAAAVLAACGGSGSNTPKPLATNSAASLDDLYAQIYPAAKAEGQVAWYTSALQDAADAFKKAFETKFPGVSVQITRGNVSQTLTKLSQELTAHSPTADLLGLSSPGQAAQFLSSGYVVPYKVFDYDKYPDTSKGDADLFEVYDKFTPYGAFVFNTNRISMADVPTSRAALAQLPVAQWTGKFVMNDIRTWPYVLNYVLWQQTNGDAMVQAIGKFKPVMSEMSQVISDGISSGQYTISPIFNMQSYINLKASGAPIDFVVPSEGIWMQPGSHFVVNGAPHPNAAKLFMEYIYSQEGQKAWSAPGYVPGRPDVDGPDGVAWVKDAKVVPIDFAKAFTDQDKLIATVKQDLA